MTGREIGALRLQRQLVAGAGAASPEAAVRHMGALQAQDYGQALWAAGCRAAGAAAADVERAIADRRIILSWTLRGTIHLVPAEDVRWMTQLCAPRLFRQARARWKQLGLDDRTLELSQRLLYAALKGGGLRTRAELMAVLEEGGIPTDKQRGYHLLWHGAYQGLIAFGPVRGKSQTFVLLDEWVPHSRELSYEESMAELAGRYFASHGPATVHDFAWWTGMTLADARTGLDAVREQLCCKVIGEVEYWLSEPEESHRPEPAGEERKEAPRIADGEQSVHLLAGFDEFILGYKDRGAVLAPDRQRRIVPGNNGIFLPTLVAGGEVVGSWKRTLGKKSVKIAIQPFRRLTDVEEAGAMRAADRYAAFMDLPGATELLPPEES